MRWRETVDLVCSGASDAMRGRHPARSSKNRGAKPRNWWEFAHAIHIGVAKTREYDDRRHRAAFALELTTAGFLTVARLLWFEQLSLSQLWTYTQKLL
ncbi:hypothetical protein SAMN05216228_101021 [Rhizobium tibeticum]|uniref:Uncharacterized protein n=1 Tax=Rhizobium tibeticum TaxID=501024 RepID=A0A1H8KYM2_9HYPH|nr:hypothetical protein RTCCBAU85039_2662 [Rhizobium tibeticum]SEN97974.1 hypothetical protein SAMN05216228_101021 [Rhizobium tibeticum]